MTYHHGRCPIPRTDPARPTTEPRLLRIQEVADEVGLTARAIRYYEDRPARAAGRSDGAYRLYDANELERLRFIKGLRDDAGFSLAQVGQLLEDEAARDRNRERSPQPRPSRATRSPRRAMARVDRQLGAAEAKAARLAAMIEGRARPAESAPRPTPVWAERSSRHDR